LRGFFDKVGTVGIPDVPEQTKSRDIVPLVVRWGSGKGVQIRGAFFGILQVVVEKRQYGPQTMPTALIAIVNSYGQLYELIYDLLRINSNIGFNS
jgi:hypothetical protein